MTINIDFGYRIFEGVEVNDEGVVAHELHEYSSSIHNNLKFCCLEGALEVNHGDRYVAVNMKLPNFFDNYHAVPDNYIALFLFKLTSPGTAKGTGKYGCPERVYWGDGRSCFTFLGNNFYPFVTINNQLGYYVCESGGRHEWPVLPSPDYFGKYKVSIDHPITYDPMLGIFTTRDAEVTS